jgi:hypothetical protein
MKIFHFLSKQASRKNLYNFIYDSVKKIRKKNFRILNIGSGGEIEDELKKYFDILYSIDIDKRRNPSQIIDLCDKDFIKKIKFKPNLVCIFEVLEHTKDPKLAINNIYKILKKNDYCLASVPFNFHIHDDPNDFWRFTSYGLKFLFKDFSEVNIKMRNGWLDSIFVNIIRLEKENNLFSKITGKFFILIYFLTYPLIQIIQKIVTSKKLTTGYYIEAKK